MSSPSLTFRFGTSGDLAKIQSLAIHSWSQYKEELTPENWEILNGILDSPSTYEALLGLSECLICEKDNQLLGMAFLVPSGNPNEIYDKDWSHLRFVSVHPEARGTGIGEQLTRKCIKLAVSNGEKIIALHTSEIMGAAIRIYEKLGFRILRELPRSLGVRYWLYTLEI